VKTKYGRAASNLKKGKYVYYRQKPGKDLEVWLSAKSKWEIRVIYWTWEDRLYAEHASPLERIKKKQLPKKARK
jgi:hypothetical protein